VVQASKEDVDIAINTIRFLSIDAVNKANSGHPGMPMGCAPIGYLLFNEFMHHNPSNPFWFNRDRFVLSAGHGSMLLYSLLHLSGYSSVSVSLSLPHHLRSTNPRTQDPPVYAMENACLIPKVGLVLTGMTIGTDGTPSRLANKLRCPQG